MKYKSIYDELMEQIGDEFEVLTDAETFEILLDINKDMTSSRYEEKVREIEAEQELASIVLT